MIPYSCLGAVHKRHHNFFRDFWPLFITFTKKNLLSKIIFWKIPPPPRLMTSFMNGPQWNYLFLHSLVGCCSKFLTSTRPHYKLPSASLIRLKIAPLMPKTNISNFKISKLLFENLECYIYDRWMYIKIALYSSWHLMMAKYHQLFFFARRILIRNQIKWTQYHYEKSLFCHN